MWFVFPYTIAHRREVFLGVGIFYLIAFLLMCRNVKEGEYPPAPPKEEKQGTFKRFATYFRECLGIPLYRNFFLVAVLVTLALNCATPFFTLFLRSGLGLDMDDLGKIFSWGAVAAMLAFYPMGWLCDRFDSLRVVQISLVGLTLVSLTGFFLVGSKMGFIVYLLIFSVPSVGWALGSLAATMHLFPQDKFGQFSSGLNVFGCGAMILGNFLIGNVMDLANSNYQVTFLWSTCFFGLALIPMTAVFREWRKHGGPDSFVPPEQASRLSGVS
jgi:MFS-type transporter involved in bile tolerance (Atg22 family)